MNATAVRHGSSRKHAPTWEIAQFFPAQGDWDDEDYLALESKLGGNPLIELSDGYLEILPMPKLSHQVIVRFIFEALTAYVRTHDAGIAIFAPLRVRLWRRKFCEPDIVFMLAEHRERAGEDFWDRADLVLEVISPDEESRNRDLRKKRAAYAKAGIPEYWIVDPELREITVLRLSGKHYIVHGKFRAGERATSVLLHEFSIDVKAVFAARA